MKCSGLFGFSKVNRKNGRLPHVHPISPMELKRMLFVKNSDGKKCQLTLIIYLKIHLRIIYHLLYNQSTYICVIAFQLSIFIFMVEPFPNLQIIQELVLYAGSRFRSIIVAMKKPHEDVEKQQEWMEKCLRQELVSINLIYHLDHF